MRTILKRKGDCIVLTKKLITTITLLGAITIIQPGQPTSHGYVGRDGDFRITTPGVGTTFGYNQGNGVTTVIRPNAPPAFIYQESQKEEGERRRAIGNLGTEGLD